MRWTSLRQRPASKARFWFMSLILVLASVSAAVVVHAAPAFATGTMGTDDYPDTAAVCKTGETGVCPNYDWGYWNSQHTSFSDLSGRGFGYRNCTDFVAYRKGLSWSSFQFPSGKGNAADWKDYASNAGLTVTNSPSVGDIAWWAAPTGYGHVAVVTAVATNNTVTVEEYNQAGTGAYSNARSGLTADAYLHSGSGGSTDTDGDGVPDSSDHCPKVVGTVPNDGCPNDIVQVSGDLNGDGKKDVIAISRGSDNAPSLSWFQSTSVGSTPSLADPVGLISLPAPAWNMNYLKWAVGDFNGDGKADIFVVSASPSDAVYMYIMLSTGTGLASPVLVKQPNPAYWLASHLEFLTGDFNGDGKTDVIAISRGSDNAPAVSWFQSTSVGSTPSLADPLGLKALPAPGWNTTHLKWAVGDFNGDGKADLFGASGSQTDPPNLYLFLSNGTTLADPVLVKQPNPTYWKWDLLQFMAGDFNGDGKADVISISRGPDNAPSLYWFQSTSVGGTPSLADPVGIKSMPAPGWNDSHLKWAVIDANADGKVDVFACSGGSTDPPALYLFTSNGAALADPVLVKQPNPAYWLWDNLQF